MSGLVVKVRRIDALVPHPNADSLELALVGGWQTVVKKDIFKNGDLVVFVPPDTVIPQELSDKLGVTKYLHKQRLTVAKLRGENSFGLLIVPEPHMWEGQDVAEYYGITKYIPPVKMSAGDAIAEAPVFFKYTDIENMRNYNNVFKEGEEVYYTEKTHGTSSRTGYVLQDGEWQFVAGSKSLQRKNTGNSLYWLPFEKYPKIKEMLEQFAKDGKAQHSVIVYGEIYGSGVQGGFDYGRQDKDFVAFDISIDGKYIDAVYAFYTFSSFEIPHVPILNDEFESEFKMERVIELSKGKSKLGGDHIREGVVVKPFHERNEPNIGRVVLKYVSDDFLHKNVKEDTTDQ